MEKKRNLWVIPTKKPSRFYYHLELKQFVLTNKIMLREFVINQNIYITSDEEIKMGEEVWYLWGDEILKNKKDTKPKHFCKKIILTTDQDLIADGVQAIDNEFLEWFVKNSSCSFVETIKTEFDANFLKPSGKYSKYYVGKEESIIGLPSLVEKINYKIIIPKEEPFKHEFKVLTTEEAAEKYGDIHMEKFDITQNKHLPFQYNDRNKVEKAFIDGAKLIQERSYSEEEVLDLLAVFSDFTNSKEYVTFNTLEEWFEQFKKIR